MNKQGLRFWCLWLWRQLTPCSLIEVFSTECSISHATHGKRHVEDMFPGRIISQGFWPPRSPDLSAPEFFLWGHLNSVVYLKHPHTLAELRANIQYYVANISQDTPKGVSQHDSTHALVWICGWLTFSKVVVMYCDFPWVAWLIEHSVGYKGIFYFEEGNGRFPRKDLPDNTASYRRRQTHSNEIKITDRLIVVRGEGMYVPGGRSDLLSWVRGCLLWTQVLSRSTYKCPEARNDKLYA
jgi:hypothetical protein